MAIIDNVTRGGQTWAHRMRMLKQVIRLMVLGSVISGLLFFVLRISKEPQERLKAAYFYYVKGSFSSAALTVEVDAEFWCKISKRCYRKPRVEVRTKDLIKACKKEADIFSTKAFLYLKESGYLSVGIFSFFLLFFSAKGIVVRKKRHVQGTRLGHPWVVNLKMSLFFKKSDIKMGTVSLVKDSEMKHMLICGATGTGKTNALRQLLCQIRNRGDRAVIVDTTGDFVSKFFINSKDILFNPYDERTQRWHPWCECTRDYDFEQMVNSLIPKTEYRYDDFFPEAGRAVLLAALKRYHEAEVFDIEGMVDDLLMKSISELYEALGDTPAQIYLDPRGEKTAVSIRATIANCVRHFSILRNTPTPFSIRKWVLTEKSSNEWLFLACKPEQRRALNGLLSLWFSVVLNAIKERSPKEAKKKIWFIIDELHALQKLEYLEESLAELRKYGGAIVLATQNVSQLDKLYGQHGARIILDQCGTKVSFRQSDAEIAKRMASFFGQREIKEIQEGLSYGAHEMRDGVSLSNIERTKQTVFPTQILNLPDLEAFIKLPGNWPALKTRFKFSK